jgi:solute carrier family 25 protein 39/40
VGIYMPLYDQLRADWQHEAGPYAPALAGTVSRLIAVFCVAPFELVRTRLQAAPSHALPSGRLSVLQAAQLGSAAPAAALRAGRLRQVARLWTGVTATLLRDVPFSALYWGMVEPMRRALLPNGPEPAGRQQVVLTNMAVGGVAGGLAAAVTTPFDVVKTRMQLGGGGGAGGGGKAGMWQILTEVQRSQGVRGLYTGVFPRSLRAAPACAIVISVYEVLKSVLAENRQER